MKIIVLETVWEARNVEFRDGKTYPRKVGFIGGIPVGLEIIDENYTSETEKAKRRKTINIREIN